MASIVDLLVPVVQLETTNNKHRKIPHNIAYTNLNHNITTSWRLSTLYVYRDNNTVASLCMVVVCAAHALASAATCVSQLFLVSPLHSICSRPVVQQQTCCFVLMVRSGPEPLLPAVKQRSVSSYCNAAVLQEPCNSCAS